MTRTGRWAILPLLTLAGATPTTLPQSAGISGTVTIDAGPSTQPTTRPAGEQYTLNLNVVGTTEYTGRVVRRPDGRLVYDVAVAVVSPKDLVRRKQVGRWTGEVPAASGTYDLSGEKLSVDAPDKDGKPFRFAEPFGGKATTRPAGPVTYARTVGGRTAVWTADAVRRIHLADVVLAMGPVPLYPRATAGGRLDVAQDGVYVDVTLATLADGKPARDVVAGTVRRVGDRYDVDLRFNAPFAVAAKGVQGRDDAFFAPDPSAASLRGTIDVATDDSPAGHRRVLTVRLNADGLSKPQAVAAFKLALACVGPLRDAVQP